MYFLFSQLDTCTLIYGYLSWTPPSEGKRPMCLTARSASTSLFSSDTISSSSNCAASISCCSVMTQRIMRAKSPLSREPEVSWNASTKRNMSPTRRVKCSRRTGSSNFRTSFWTRKRKTDVDKSTNVMFIRVYAHRATDTRWGMTTGYDLAPCKKREKNKQTLESFLRGEFRADLMPQQIVRFRTQNLLVATYMLSLHW